MIPPSGALGHFLGLSGGPTLGEPRPPPAPGRVFLRFGEGEPWGEGEEVEEMEWKSQKGKDKIIASQKTRGQGKRAWQK